MYCLLIIYVSVVYRAYVLSDTLSDGIRQYFESESVKTMKRVWDKYKETVEDALVSALQEDTEDYLKEYKIRPSNLRLAKAYYHKNGPVEVIFQNLDLRTLPRSSKPNVSLSLDSNILKIETALTQMIINANYLLMRNKSDIIYTVQQDPYLPFLYGKVRNTGKITIWVDGCILHGHVITRLKGGTIELGHDKLTLTRCTYTLHIYNIDTPTFTVRYSIKKPAYSLGIKHYLLKAIRKKFITKLSHTILNVVNTSAIFGHNLSVYEKEQKILFLKTLGNLAALVKDQNRNVLNLNGGTFNIRGYSCTWDYMDNYEYAEPLKVKLSKIMLSGLDTAIFSQTGGPYMYNKMMIGEQQIFSNLQVHAEIPAQSQNEDTLQFSVTITDFSLNVEVALESEGPNQANIESVGYRQIKFDRADIISMPMQSLIVGYLMDEIPKAIINTVTLIANMPTPLSVIEEFKSKNRQTENSEGLANNNTSETGLKAKLKKQIYAPLPNNQL